MLSLWLIALILYLKYILQVNMLISLSRIRLSSFHVSKYRHNLAQMNPQRYLQLFGGGYRNLGDEIVYNHYRRLIQRRIEYPTGKVVSFDVISQGSGSITAFLWNTTSASTTLVKEYHPGVQKLLYGVVAGVFEPAKHSSSLQCAQAEVEEEAQRVSGTWIPLLEGVNATIPLEKYSDNVFTPYLVLDTEITATPKPPDAEELIEIIENVTFDELMKIILAGEMNIVSSFSVVLALQKLEQLGFQLKK
jgi:hypothetical protein